MAPSIGATWGVTYQKSTKTIFTSAILKRHVGFGPDGIDAIYPIQYIGGTATVLTAINLFDDLGINVGTNPRTISLPVSPATPSHDPEVLPILEK